MYPLMLLSILLLHLTLFVSASTFSPLLNRNPKPQTQSQDESFGVTAGGLVTCNAPNRACGSYCQFVARGDVCCAEGYVCPGTQGGSFCLAKVNGVGRCCPRGENPTTCARNNGIQLPAKFLSSSSNTPSPAVRTATPMAVAPIAPLLRSSASTSIAIRSSTTSRSTTSAFIPPPVVPIQTATATSSARSTTPTISSSSSSSAPTATPVQVAKGSEAVPGRGGSDLMAVLVSVFCGVMSFLIGF